ncbi:hypothetical protein D3C80_1995930 [compost metagenome]
MIVFFQLRFYLLTQRGLAAFIHASQTDTVKRAHGFALNDQRSVLFRSVSIAGR